MPWQLDTSSPMFQSMSPTQQAQIQQQYGSGTFDNPPVPVAQEGANLQQTQASIPGVAAQSQKEQIQAQQAAALKSLRSDLTTNKMTLHSAISKYTALGMSADDVFSNYLSQSPWGLPNENPQELQNMGVSAKALGAIGTPGSFMDRYNTRNAISGLHDLQDKWSQLQASAHLPFISSFDQNAKAYHAARQVFGEHLSSLIPGASGAQQSVTDLLNTLPDIGDITQAGVGAGTKQFNSVEDQLLKTKGYAHKDLGLTPNLSQILQSGNSQTNTQPKGNDLLSTLLTNAAGDIKGDIQGAEQNKQFGVNSLNPTDQGNIKGLGGMVQEYGSLISNPLQHATEHPVNTALDLLPFLGLLKPGESGISDTGGGNGGATIKDPSALQKILAPGKIKQTAGTMRDNLVKQSSSAGNTIPGDNIIQQLQSWADTIGKPGNPGQNTKIDNIVQEAKNTYAGKQINPADAQKIYNEVDSGYNQKNVQKDAIQSRGDIALRQILRGEIEKVAPGFDKLTNIIGQGYTAEKSAGAKFVQKLPQNAAKVGMEISGLGMIGRILGL